MESASGKRPPDEAHGPGEETIRPQQCTAPNSKSQMNFVKHFAISVLFSKFRLFLITVVQNSQIVIEDFQNLSNVY